MLEISIGEPIDNTWTIERIAREHPPATWEQAFLNATNELRDISNTLIDQEKMYGPFLPNKEDIFAAFNRVPLPQVKVVIFGQDPYHQYITIDNKLVPRAIGSAFSLRIQDEVSSSLKNVYKELQQTVRGFVIPDHGNLRTWESQGVLLLNACLTVRPNQAGSHGSELWSGFLKHILQVIDKVNPYCIYVMWGKEAQKMIPLLGSLSIKLTAAHPSGFSARKGFFGCNHFNLINEQLVTMGKEPIIWSIPKRDELLRGIRPITHINPNIVPYNAIKKRNIDKSMENTNEEDYDLPVIQTII